MGGDRWKSSARVIAVILTSAIIAGGCEDAAEPDLDVIPECGFGGSPRPEVELWDILYRADTEVIGEAPTEIQTTVTATNTLDTEITVVWPTACEVQLRAYIRPLSWGKRVWWQIRDCVYEHVVSYAPHETKEFHETVTASEILGDSLPEGCYWFGAIIQPNLAWIELEAGKATLRR
jgi:hypothetical protein